MSSGSGGSEEERRRRRRLKLHPKIPFRADIEGLRAIAILLVLLDHLKVPGFKGGFIGVDVFFVISGFLITSLLAVEQDMRSKQRRKKTKSGRKVLEGISIRDFYERRARRILPASLTVIAFTLIVSKLLFNDLRFAEVQADALWATLFAANIHLMDQATDYFAQGLSASPLQNYWSLAVEEQFYLVWPVLFVIAAKLGSGASRRDARRWLGRVRNAILVLVGLSFAWSVVATASNPAPAYFSPFTRAWQLAAGAALALWFHKREGLGRQASTAAGLAGVALIAAALIVIGPDTPVPGWIALLPTLGAVMLLAAGVNANTQTPTGKVLSTAPARFIGRISYSLYLWHWPIIVFAASIVSTRTFGGAPRWITLAAISIAIAWVSYRVIENPFRRLKLKGRYISSKGKWKGSQVDAVRLAAMATMAIAVIGTISAFARPASPDEEAALLADARLARMANWNGRSDALPANGATPGLMSKAAWVKALHEGVEASTATTAELAKAKGAKALAPNADCFNIRSLTQAKGCRIRGKGAAGLQWPDRLEKTVALIGNSFAAQWRETIASILPPDVTIIPITLTSCEPWAPKTYHRKNSHGDDCGDHVAFVEESLPKLNPGLIIFGGVSGEQPAAWASLAKQLAKVQPNVLQIGSPPFVKDFSQCLGSGSSIRPCNGPVYPNELSKDQTGESAVKAAGAKYFSTAGVFCWRGVCPAIIDGSPTHTDGHHLTASAMKGVASFLADSVADAAGAKFQASRAAARGGDVSESAEPAGQAWLQAVKTASEANTASPAELALSKAGPKLGPQSCWDNTSNQAMNRCSAAGKGKSLEWPAGSSRNVVLFGNSFAAQWRESLARVLPPDTRLYPATATGCDPSAPSRIKINSHGINCEDALRFAKSTIARLKPGLVVFSVTNGSKPADVGRLLASILKPETRVLWIGFMPVLKPIDQCLGSNGDVSSCKVMPAKFATAIALDAGEASRRSVSFLDITSAFCIRLICPPFVQGKPITTDGHHLTTFAMRSAEPLLRKSVETALSK